MTAVPETSALVELLIARLLDSYIFPDRAQCAAELLRARLAEGAYPPAIGAETCERISDDLLEATEDKHLRLLWHETIDESQDEAQLVAALRERIRLENNGVRRVELRPGNIGLIELTILPEASTGGASLSAAMSLVQYTDALILDLRGTLGGAQDGVVFVASHFFADGDVHLLDLVEGPDGPTRQYWTCAHLPGVRYVDRPVFVLTSSTTFSGGEALAFSLQAHGRATIVGEATRGGAHPSMVTSLTEHVELRLPVARSIDPASGANWEGSGVRPEVDVAAADALEAANLRALYAIAADGRLSETRRAEALHLRDSARAPGAASLQPV